MVATSKLATASSSPLPRVEVLEEDKNGGSLLKGTTTTTTTSLMERVRSLENRLMQLCVELELRGMSLPETPLFQAFKETSLVQHSSNKLSTLPQVVEEEHRPKPKKGSEMPKKKAVVTRKKGNWFNLKLLGC